MKNPNSITEFSRNCKISKRNHRGGVSA